MARLPEGGAVCFERYGRPGRHLCDEMHAALEPVLAGTHARVERIDVDRDPAWRARYGERVPVLVCGGAELCHHRLDKERVRTVLLSGRNPFRLK
ncbi:glutaredoxin [Burkholderia sp. WAC0059]|uniref:glutaredoxin family protein n=1 Tax=Burkholderia sp. WAC0059 TaxID=2066022 RepID=UPI000C7E9911|nr:glutaredoxin family protein [Burkholderia sp. WAC0059]PLZ02500.1 glutaredoxin [Burkholderia sp. WAC0059]